MKTLTINNDTYEIVDEKARNSIAEVYENMENGELDGAPGKSAYQYAKEGGYKGTEADFAYKLAEEYPTKLSQFENDSGYITSADVPASSGSGIHIDAKAPTDPNVNVWIDTDEEPEASGGADWNANEGEPGHVLNRTHYSTYESATLLDNQLIESIEPFDFALVEGQTYHIVWDGAEFDRVAKSVDMGGMSPVVIGNDVFLGGDDTGEPYAFIYVNGMGTQIFFNDESATVTLSTVQEVVHKLPEKYLPDNAPFYFDIFVKGLTWVALVATWNLDEAYAAGRTIIAKLIMNADDTKMTHLLRLCSIGENMPDTIGNVYGFEGASYKVSLTPQESGEYSVNFLNGDESI